MTCTAGDIFEFRPAARANTKETLQKAEACARVFGIMDYDAIALGEKDLAFGRDVLYDLAETHGLRFVCANAVDRKSRELLFDPYIVREIDGLKVAFIGIVSPERHIIAQVESELLDKNIEIRDPTEYVNKILPQARAESDVVVLLSHTGIETSEFLAQDLDVDVVCVGHYPAILNQPKKIGDTIMVMAGAKSDRFGTLDLTIGPDGDVTEFQGDAIRLMSKGPEITEISAIFRAIEE